MASRFGHSRVRLGHALQLQDGRLILVFGTKISGTSNSAFGRAFGKASLPLKLPDQVIDFGSGRVKTVPAHGLAVVSDRLLVLACGASNRGAMKIVLPDNRWYAVDGQHTYW